jgi:hypothetical protein
MIDAVDCAVPHPGEYPTHLVCGYVGGHTYHVWTNSEIAEVAQEGRVFLAIWTALNKVGVLSGTLGAQDAVGMVQRLTALNYPKHYPVFYDVEPGIYDRDPAGAGAAINAWKIGMEAAGWIHAFDYTVMRQGGDWVADWTNIRPLSIPKGKIGIQWGGNGSFDFDVFADNILGADMTQPTDWTDASWDLFFKKMADRFDTENYQGILDPAVSHTLRGWVSANNMRINQAREDIASLRTTVNSILAVVQKLQQASPAPAEYQAEIPATTVILKPGV